VFGPGVILFVGTERVIRSRIISDYFAFLGRRLVKRSFLNVNFRKKLLAANENL
jgi:hypothetical protein